MSCTYCSECSFGTRAAKRAGRGRQPWYWSNFFVSTLVELMQRWFYRCTRWFLTWKKPSLSILMPCVGWTLLDSWACSVCCKFAESLRPAGQWGMLGCIGWPERVELTHAGHRGNPLVAEGQIAAAAAKVLPGRCHVKLLMKHNKIMQSSFQYTSILLCYG